VNPLVYWLVRALLQPFFHLYFRLSRIGREHLPESGPVIYCSNHRSFLDPFVIGTVARRPIYYVAKQELFRYRIVAWLLNSLGAFPVKRGAGDQDMLATAKAILERGDSVLMFAEGTRIRPGALGRPKRGVGRLALETGAPVVPVAVIGTEAVRKGWRIRPHKVRIRIGSPLTFPKVEKASPQLAAAVTDRIWPNVMLQWEWLGGLPPLRRAAVIGAGSWGTSVAVMLARAGLEVDLGTRTREHAEAVAAQRRNDRHLPGVELPAAVNVLRAAELELSRHDLVCFAVPAGSLPAAVAEHAPRIPSRAGVLVLSKGLVAPLGTLPAAYVSERTESWAVGVLGGPAHGADALGGASLVLAAADAAFRRQVTDALTAAGFDAAPTPDVIGVELAGCATNAAALAAAAASRAGRSAAGSAAGKVFGEIEAYARSAGAEPGTFAGLAGAGDLVAAVLDRRAGDASGPGVPLLADRIRDAGVDAPTLRGLANLIEGKVTEERWTASLTAPRPAAAREKVRAA
jgi:1-acyl-sn-glycerol-3-phosphate acyltransferase